MYTIMIVDDEPMTREYMKQHIPLVNKAWSVPYEAANGFEGMQILKEHAVDLVITDIRMPQMDGLQFCHEIRQLSKEQFVAGQFVHQQLIVILSGHDEFAYSKEAIKYGVNEYLLKPIDHKSLSQMLVAIEEKLIARKQETDHYQVFYNIADEYNRNILNSYMQALVDNNKIQQRTLSPLLSRNELETIKPGGGMLVFRLDIECLIELKLPFDDAEMYNYIMFQVISEYALEFQNTYAFLDSRQNTVVYFNDDTLGGSRESRVSSAHDFFSYINDFMQNYTGFSVTAGYYGPVLSIEDFPASARLAYQAFVLKLLDWNSGFYTFDSSNSTVQESLSSIAQTINNTVAEYTAGGKESFRAALSHSYALLKAVFPNQVILLSVELLSALHLSLKNQTVNHNLFYESFSVLIEQLTLCEKPTADDAVSALLNAMAIFQKDREAVSESSAKEYYLRCKDFIHENFHQPITLSQIADYVGVSPNYLSNIFREYENQSYIKYITKCRMEYAAVRLKQDRFEKLVVVAESCGYNNIKHFHYVFKQYFKMTPGDYQKTYGS